MEAVQQARPELVVYLNGEFVPESQAKISIFDHLVLFGDGVFDTLCAWNGRIFRIEDHLDRLFRSATAVNLEIPLTRDELRRAIAGTIVRNELRNAYCKFIVSRGVGPGPLLDPRGCRPSVIIFAKPYMAPVSDEKRKRGVAAKTVSVRRLPVDCLDSRIKHCNYLPHVLARLEANLAGADDAIELAPDGTVAESPGYNIFTVQDGALLTPARHVLHGITRDTVMRLARKNGYACTVTEITTYDLYTADEVFLTSTAGGVFPVTSIDGRVIGTGECGSITDKVMESYWELLESGDMSIDPEEILAN